MSMPQAAPPPAPTTPTTRFLGELEVLVRANCPLVYLVSAEEKRVEAMLGGVAQARGKALHVWSLTRGLRGAEASDSTRDPVAALERIGKLERSMVLLADIHRHLDDPRVVRAIRELGHVLRAAQTTCVLLAPTLVMPVELEKDVNVLDVPLPGVRELGNLLREMVGALRQSNAVQVDVNRVQAEQMVKAALGLTLQEAENAFAKAIAHDARIDAEDIRLVLEEKRQVIRKSGLLEYHPTQESLSRVGGLVNLKAWLAQRASAFSDAARSFGLPEPKGLLLLGIQGCGKTLISKAIASEWGLPLLRLDMGRIFGGGNIEENLRRAIAVAESAAPAVLWIDEVEKAIGGISGPGVDGAGSRAFGALLTWLQDKRAPVFVVATANRIDALPPELLRKGRFDEIFFVDLPDAKERAEIFGIHLRRRGRDPAKYELAQLGSFTDGFSGAEIEQVIVAALYQAFAQQAELAQEHLVQAVRETYPLSKTLREEVQKLRRWALDRTRPASVRSE